MKKVGNHWLSTYIVVLDNLKLGMLIKFK
jgi:hypothetical protein